MRRDPDTDEYMDGPGIAPSEGLRQIIEEAYALFKPYTASAPLDACTVCCMSESDEQRLEALPVRQIPHSLLYEYQSAAKPTSLEVEELKHFAPRYLDLLAHMQQLQHSTEICLSRFGMVKSEVWTPEEAELLQRWSSAMMHMFLERYPLRDNWGATELLAQLLMLHKGRFKLAPLLNIWAVDQSMPSLLHYCNLLTDELDHGYATKIANAFSDGAASETVVQWAYSEPVLTAFLQPAEAYILGEPSLPPRQDLLVNQGYEVMYSLLKGKK